MSFLHLLAFAISFTVVHSLHNVTVDDSASSIVYIGPWSTSTSNSLDWNNSHKVTADPSATAHFTFTGVAVYYLAPRWPHKVTTSVSLDSAPATVLDLTDPNRKDDGTRFETVASAVIWGISGLNNTEHTLVISVAASDSYAVMDALMYTALDKNDNPSAFNSSTPITTSVTPSITSAGHDSAPSASSTPTHTSNVLTPPKILGIVLPTVIAVCALLVCFIGCLCGSRRHRFASIFPRATYQVRRRHRTPTVRKPPSVRQARQYPIVNHVTHPAPTWHGQTRSNVTASHSHGSRPESSEEQPWVWRG